MLTFLPLRSPNWVSWAHSALPLPGDVPLALLLPSESLPPQPARTSPPLTRTAATAIPRRVLRDRMRAFLSGLSAGPSSPRAFKPAPSRMMQTFTRVSVKDCRSRFCNAGHISMGTLPLRDDNHTCRGRAAGSPSLFRGNHAGLHHHGGARSV